MKAEDSMQPKALPIGFGVSNSNRMTSLKPHTNRFLKIHAYDVIAVLKLVIKLHPGLASYSFKAGDKTAFLFDRTIVECSKMISITFEIN